MNKNGRPKSEKSRNGRFDMRMSESELKMLDEVSDKTGKSRAYIIREGIRMQYNLMKARE